MGIYRGLVGEALLKIMTGVFLFETFRIAESDNDLLIVKKEKQLRSHIARMHTFFVEADRSKDGSLTWDEFRDITSDPRVRTWLQALQLDVSDAERVFRLCDDGDQKLTAEKLPLDTPQAGDVRTFNKSLFCDPRSLAAFRSTSSSSSTP